MAKFFYKNPNGTIAMQGNHFVMLTQEEFEECCCEEACICIDAECIQLIVPSRIESIGGFFFIEEGTYDIEGWDFASECEDKAGAPGHPNFDVWGATVPHFVDGIWQIYIHMAGETGDEGPVLILTKDNDPCNPVGTYSVDVNLSSSLRPGDANFTLEIIECSEDECENCHHFEGRHFEMVWPNDWTFTEDGSTSLPAGQYTIPQGTYRSDNGLPFSYAMENPCIGAIEIELDGIAASVVAYLKYEDGTWMLYLSDTDSNDIKIYDGSADPCLPSGTYTVVDFIGPEDAGMPSEITVTVDDPPPPSTALNAENMEWGDFNFLEWPGFGDLEYT